MLGAADSCLGHPDDVVATFTDRRLGDAVAAALGLDDQSAVTCGLATGLMVLQAPGAGIRSLVGVQNLTTLQELYLYGGNSVADLTPLSGLASLRSLNLARNEVRDLGPLSGLTSLRSLNLYGNPIRDLAPLAGLTGLTSLRVEASPLEDIDPLRTLTGLTRLELADNAFTDIAVLGGLTRLTWLTLQGNRRLADVGVLSGLIGLETLDLSGTAVRDLGPLSGLTALASLGLMDLSLTDIGVLRGLTALARLDLRNNGRLRDVRPLLDNPGIDRDDEIRLEGTGVSCADVGLLRERGVVVYSQCR